MNGGTDKPESRVFLRQQEDSLEQLGIRGLGFEDIVWQ